VRSHRIRQIENITAPAGRQFIYCDCGWSAGPNVTRELYRDHAAHVDHVRGLRAERKEWPDDGDPEE
jgi:hypothetical protein